MIRKDSFHKLNYGEKLKAAEKIGEKVGEIIQKAVDRCNKQILAKYGFKVSVTLNFHYLNEEPENLTITQNE